MLIDQFYGHQLSINIHEALQMEDEANTFWCIIWVMAWMPLSKRVVTTSFR